MDELNLFEVDILDKILIKDLQVYAYHGVNIEEKKMGQRFLISLELYLDLKAAGESDDLNKTVNYAELCEKIEEKFLSEKFNLIEKCVYELAEFILINYPIVEGVKIQLKKPWAPVGKPLDYVAVEIERFWHKAYIGIGSNIGDKEKNIEEAVENINKIKCTSVIKQSKNYNTKPVGYTDQDDFVNAAIEIKTLLSPKELLDRLMEIEKELKRERIIKWGPRTIDLDVILYDDLVTTDENIVIPHPRMHERLFVLKPLSDIAPFLLHPILKKRIVDITEEVSHCQIL